MLGIRIGALFQKQTINNRPKLDSFAIKRGLFLLLDFELLVYQNIYKSTPRGSSSQSWAGLNCFVIEKGNEAF